jgi:hypothetical protein
METNLYTPYQACRAFESLARLRTPRLEFSKTSSDRLSEPYLFRVLQMSWLLELTLTVGTLDSDFVQAFRSLTRLERLDVRFRQRVFCSALPLFELARLTTLKMRWVCPRRAVWGVDALSQCDGGIVCVRLLNSSGSSPIATEWRTLDLTDEPGRVRREWPTRDADQKAWQFIKRPDAKFFVAIEANKLLKVCNEITTRHPKISLLD